MCEFTSATGLAEARINRRFFLFSTRKKKKKKKCRRMGKTDFDIKNARGDTRQYLAFIIFRAKLDASLPNKQKHKVREGAAVKEERAKKCAPRIVYIERGEP